MKKISLIFSILVVMACSCQSQNTKQTLSATEFNQVLQQKTESTILDVRTPNEYAGGHLVGARNVDYRAGNFQHEILKMDRDRPYFVYCLSGGRSSSAAKFMRENGFKEVYDMQGGIMAWQGNNLPLADATNEAADKYTMADITKLTTENQAVLIDFNAPWCGPCVKMKPMIDELTKAYEGKVKIINLNVDESKKLTQELGIQEIPHFKLYKAGKETWSHTGLIEKDALKKVLD